LHMRITIEDSFVRKNNEEERQKLIKDCEMFKKMLDEAYKRKKENSQILDQIVDYPSIIK